MKRRYLFITILLCFFAAFIMGTRIVLNGVPYETFTDLLVTRNALMGNARVEVTASSTLTTNQVRRGIVTNYGMGSGGDTTLPAYSGSTSFTVMTEAASQSWSLKPPSGEVFVLDGTALDADDEIDIGQTAGNCASLVRIRTGASTYQWYFYTVSGTHSDGGAS